jgi:hypothetical protein
MIMRRTCLDRHRLPLAALVAPETLARIGAIQEEAGGRFSRGRILDLAIQVAEKELMKEALGRQIVVIVLSPQTERNLGLMPEP